MTGEREIDVLLLPEMSRAERAGRAKKNEHFPLSCPQAARPQRGGAIGRSSIVATLEGKSLSITPFGLYPAGRVSGRGPAGLGKPKLLLVRTILPLYVPSTYFSKTVCTEYVLRTESMIKVRT